MLHYLRTIWSSFWEKRRYNELHKFIALEIEKRVHEIVASQRLVDPLPPVTKSLKKMRASRRTVLSEFFIKSQDSRLVREPIVSGNESTSRVRDAFVAPRQSTSSKSGSTPVYPRYDYRKIDRYFRTESYFSRSIWRQIETMLRNGFYIVSEEMRYGKQVREHLIRFSLISHKSLRSVVARMTLDLLKYGVFIMRKVWKTIDGKKQLVNLVPLSVGPGGAVFVTDNSGSVIGIQDVGGSLLAKGGSSEPLSNFIIGFFYDAGTDVYPEPPCLQIIDDILTLRSFEETVEMLSYQYSSPLLHAKVGTKEDPCRRGETASVASSIEQMAPNGVIVTDNRVEIESVRLQSGVSNLIPYIEHFKDRVFIGSGSSGVLVGEGDTANRATSESIDNALSDRCSYLSSIIENVFTFQLIPDILEVIGAPSFVDDEGEPLVTLEFNEMSTSRMIEKANNAINLYQGNLITSREARKILKRAPLPESEWGDTYLNRVQIPLAQAKSSAPVLNPTLTQPTNQYGKKSAPGSRKD